MTRRISITLPEDTLDLLDRVCRKEDRSRVIDEAVRFYIDRVGRDRLRERLAQGYARHNDRDVRLAEEWFPVEEDTRVDGGE
ncbi:ribbon-helix-helix protein, CopG family [Candidatus Poribacteria bacterium]|nr:ribbon-helix-helix protein, CopG family [Candidatus Poribacteria bacterium]MBT5533291.1 ribbon-helix-helix protein, CopG family [Candidatus Poribacteria bacterium]MBT5712387.1 ribbon-helix-helix protein, CopG family [Candidatus Poribacteria bacterium]MBT7098004.1 ribbon-helix-helix protein, CopG family [Candidatus Poribacteria bacterium]MBT7807468.1 ribbon-helix-helix protein, CopG family [Candidatus Poribacteria bacterium]